MHNLMVIENETGNGCIMTLLDAAELTKIEPEIIEQLMLELAVCQSIDYTILDTEAADEVLHN